MNKSILSSPQNNCGKKPHYMWVWFIEGGRKTTALFCNMLVVVPHTTTHWWHHFFLLGVEVPGCKGRLKTEPCVHQKFFFLSSTGLCLLHWKKYINTESGSGERESVFCKCIGAKVYAHTCIYIVWVLHIRYLKIQALFWTVLCVSSSSIKLHTY